MSEILTLLLGLVLGTIFFGGLWWTVRKAVSSKAPAIWFLGSLLLRMGLTLAGFYAISSEGMAGLAICLLGFLIGRQAVLWLSRPTERVEATHAP